MSTYYDVGVKLALEEVSQAFKMTSSQSAASPSKVKLPKPPTPKMPPKSQALKQPTVAPPKALPTSAPDTGPYGLRYGGRGVDIRSA
ncbi:MAG: hypothetical protein DRJ03_01910 [Chloroflexi bacterium]|nr:MAG: hypothetical protein DRJ03_01910 [Chloroflexota bacterium]